MYARKAFILMSLVGWGTLSVPSSAQDMRLTMKTDSTFNAAYDESKTFKGFDVDTSQVNVINLAFQLALDAAVANTNHSDVTNSLPSRSYFRQRADLVLSSALPERTNVYATVSFMNNEEGTRSNASLVITNLEIEHYFRRNMKFRIGRLCNSVSESQFFGRIALEESSAHMLGRKIFINDAFEWDGRFRANGRGVFFVGLKPFFKPFNLKSFYAGMHHPFVNGFQMHTIVSLNRMFEEDIQPVLPDFTGKDVFFSYEAEVAHKTSTHSLFLNVGGNVGSLGMIPHTSGPYDILKQARPIVTRKGDSFKETFITSTGFRIYPAKMYPNSILKQVGLEAEVQGALTDRFTALNVCAYCKIGITRRLILSYFCTPEFIWQDCNPGKPSFMGGVVNFLRLNVTVGKPGRMFM
jgi:hypothetical protein